MKSPLSCRNCRMRKKKCDRAFPICHHCLTTRSRCSYQVGRPGGNGSDSGKSANPPSPLAVTNNLSWLSVPAAINFLDYKSLEKVSSEVPDARIAVGPKLRRFVCDDEHLTQHIAAYTDTIDRWLPIIRHGNLKKWGSISTSQLNGEEILLLACLKNLVLTPPNDNPATKQYLAIKSAFIGAELSGPVTITTVQAYVLLLLYEFGHGIYPSAYTTLGTCIRYLTVLGIDDASPLFCKPATWIELEEQRRLWWAIFAMERAIALGCPQRPLTMKEPSEDKELPTDEVSWDQESQPPEPQLTLTSSAMPNMGNMRLLAHASSLLGRVLQHVSAQAMPEKDGTEQMYRTIYALINVLEVENQFGIMTVGVPRSILNSAIFVLYSSAAPVQLDSSSPLQDPRYLSALNYMERSRLYFKGGLGPMAVGAPFLLNWGFQVFRVYHQIYRQERNVDNVKPLKELGEAFHELDKRWKVAGVYASILNMYQFL